MRSVLSVLIMVLFCANVQAQSGKGKITGKVIDAVTKQPVDYATVSVFKQGSTSPFNGIITDAKGNFTVDNVPPGDYRLTVDFLGYQRSTIEHAIVTDGGTATVGSISLSPTQNQLAGVTVTAKAPVIENRIDKLVYNAQNDLTAQGGVAIDILKKVPQVTVDIDGNVELQGNANIRFLINGKPSSIFGSSLADALQSIPASQIKSIEVITSPGAKYDAAGTGGIINIILKDSKVQGINGNVNISAGTRQENGSFNLSGRKGNFGVNAFFSGNAFLNATSKNTNNRRSVDADGNTTYLYQDGSSKFNRGGYQSGLSAEWAITPKDNLIGTIGFNHFANKSNGATDQRQSFFDMLDNPLADTNSIRNSNNRFSFNSVDVSLGYKKNFKKDGQTLDVLYNSSFGRNTSEFSQIQNYTTPLGIPNTGTSSNNPGRDRQTQINVDYAHPVSKTFVIETGAKADLEHINNTVALQRLQPSGQFVPDPGQSYTFNYDRNIYAYYLSTTFSLFKNFLDVKAGGRYEYTKTTADFPNTTIPSYGIFAPSFTLSHKLDETSSIKVSYTYRIERPEYRDVNPFYNISDPHNISTGNPNLKPETGKNIEVAYNKSFNQGGNINVAMFYRANSQDIQGYTFFYPELAINDTVYTNVTLNTRANIGQDKRAGLNLYGSLPIGKKLNLRSNMFFGGRFLRNSINGENRSVNSFGYRINLNASYNFGNDLNAEAFGNYNSSQRLLQGINPRWMSYSIAIRKQLLNKKASIGLVANNPFNYYVRQRSTVTGANFDQESIRLQPVQSFGITLSYKFGKLEFKDKENNRDREGGNDSVGGSEGR